MGLTFLKPDITSNTKVPNDVILHVLPNSISTYDKFESILWKIVDICLSAEMYIWYL